MPYALIGNFRLTTKHRQLYRIEGIVQGVGFRPFVYTLALRFSLKGYVLNNSLGVEIDLEGSFEAFENFEKTLLSELPPLARIDTLQKTTLDVIGYDSFEIHHSQEGNVKSSLVLPDMSLCEDCLRELNDPHDRRYHYFFINCTNCGPRYSIIKTVPYDRPNTSMAPFVMCEACQAEYTNPLDRRYHAQPISCPTCGPRLTLKTREGELLATNEEAIENLASYIEKGYIVAMKGMGGFHLICDATQDDVVRKLRSKKHRPTKPFAVMFPTLETIENECVIAPSEKEGLTSLLRPIVLLKRHKNHASIVSSFVAPSIDRLGVFLPYTPLHVRLLSYLKTPIIATSANRSGEPIITTEDEIVSKLFDVVDVYLDYNRDIVNPSDDSVVQYIDEKPLLMRLSRGIAPLSFRTSYQDERSILALGAHQKNAIAIYLNHQIIVSPYIGDLDNVASCALFEKVIETFEHFYNFKPDLIVCDKHPYYASTQWAKKRALPLIQVQHHYAHILSTLFEHKLDDNVLGIAWDGTGYGDDGTIWGGEFFTCNAQSYARVAHFEPFLLLGGDASIKDIRRVLASILWDSEVREDADALLLDYFNAQELKSLKQLHTKKLNSPLCTSVGRIFDAVALLCGAPSKVSYDGEAGLIVEQLYDSSICEAYTFVLQDGIITYKHLFLEMLHDKEPSRISSKFINGLAKLVHTLGNIYALPMVLSGGVFQNRTLLECILKEQSSYPIYFPHQLPPNDGDICVGQLYYALHLQNNIN